MQRLALLFCLFPAAGEAGAWLREDGRWFASASAEIGDSGLEDSVGLYVEYGLTEATTLSADISYSPEFGLNHARIFIRRPLFETGRHVFSYATGFGWGKDTLILDEPVFATVGTTRVFVGTIENSVEVEGYEGLGMLSWGMGLDGGWANVDAQVIWQSEADTLTTKIDATRGWTAFGGLAITQLQVTLDDDATFARVVPSYVRPLSDTLSVEIGVSTPVEGGGDTRIKLGVWAEF